MKIKKYYSLLFIINPLFNNFCLYSYKYVELEKVLKICQYEQKYSGRKR